jgi:hypothetical protein
MRYQRLDVRDVGKMTNTQHYLLCACHLNASNRNEHHKDKSRAITAKLKGEMHFDLSRLMNGYLLGRRPECPRQPHFSFGETGRRGRLQGSPLQHDLPLRGRHTSQNPEHKSSARNAGIRPLATHRSPRLPVVRAMSTQRD